MQSRRVGNLELMDRVSVGSGVELWQAKRPGRVIAVKWAHVGGPEQVSKALQREARLLAARPIDALCKLDGTGQTEGRRWLAIEWVDGVDLAQVLRVGDKACALEPSLAAFLVAEIADVLASLHEAKIPGVAPRGLLHGDLSPRNIRIALDGRIKLLNVADFRALDARGVAEESGRGTLRYMAPEQVNDGPQGVRAEIYSLGVMLTELVAGRSPYEARDEEELVRAVGEGGVKSPSALLEGFPADLEAICLRALSPSPEGRFASMRELSIVLRAFSDFKSPAEGRAALVALAAALRTSSEKIPGLIVTDHACEVIADRTTPGPLALVEPKIEPVSHREPLTADVLFPADESLRAAPRPDELTVMESLEEMPDEALEILQTSGIREVSREDDVHADVASGLPDFEAAAERVMRNSGIVFSEEAITEPETIEEIEELHAIERTDRAPALMIAPPAPPEVVRTIEDERPTRLDETIRVPRDPRWRRVLLAAEDVVAERADAASLWLQTHWRTPSFLVPAFAVTLALMVVALAIRGVRPTTDISSATQSPVSQPTDAPRVSATNPALIAAPVAAPSANVATRSSVAAPVETARPAADRGPNPSSRHRTVEKNVDSVRKANSPMRRAVPARQWPTLPSIS